jgi:hypothetical protein
MIKAIQDFIPHVIQSTRLRWWRASPDLTRVSS